VISGDAAGGPPAPDAAGRPSAPDAVKILIDSPSKAPSLGFGPTAAALAQIIGDSPARFAVGIFGGWGSGKTTLMDEIRRKLDTAVVTVEFNAWRYEREPQLLIPLLDTVRGALVKWAAGLDADSRERVRAAARRVGRIIRGLAAGLSGEVGLPGAAKVSYDVGKAVDALTMSGEPDQPQSLYVAAFHELSDAFEDVVDKGAAKIVVFVDDLDRCLPDNALDVLESMKLFFDLPGFVFVVGLDEDVVQRAVRTRFPEPASSVPVRAAADGPAASITPEAQLALDYVEKIFQVPYRLPPVVAEQLTPLLEAMYAEADLSDGQLADFRQRVAAHLQYVAVRGQVNPREVKRFLNTYTLQMLVRPYLNRDVVLSLQTLVFRYDWRSLYDAILTDSMLFSDALDRFRGGDDRAFGDLSPELSAVQEELATYLRSPAVAALAGVGSLDPYLTSLESTGRTPRWLTEAYREIGRLRQEIRNTQAMDPPTEAQLATLVQVAAEVAAKLESQFSASSAAAPADLPGLLTEIRTITEPIQQRGPFGAEGEQARPSADLVPRLDVVATRVYRALRVVRSTLLPTTLS
jgi:KAP family P-loop domain